MISLEKAIIAFRTLLLQFWGELSLYPSSDDNEVFVQNWLQANWELLVESAFPAEQGVFLEVYGDGADCNGESSRVLYPDKLPNYSVYCQLKENEVGIDRISNEEVVFSEKGMPFDRFVAIEKGWYFERPPFDHVLLTVDGGTEVALNLKLVKFVLVENEAS